MLAAMMDILNTLGITDVVRFMAIAMASIFIYQFFMDRR